jgi:hypothetical protein
MLERRGYIVNKLCSLIPYLLVAWVLNEFVGEGSYFWMILGIMLLIRLGFSIMEAIGGILAWRFYNRKVMVNRVVDFLKAHNFPPRRCAFDDFDAYLSRIDKFGQYPPKLDMYGKFIPEESPRYYSQELINEARNFEQRLLETPYHGLFEERRLNGAYNLALDIYAPRDLAPKALDGDSYDT